MVMQPSKPEMNLTEETGISAWPGAQEQAGRDKSLSLRPELRAPVASPQVDWGEALAPAAFYGREEELLKLTQWVIQEHCRVVCLLGLGGIGKSVLSVSLMYRLSRHFEVVIFRSLRDAPALEVLLDDCLQVLSPQSPRQVDLQRRISLLLSHLHKARVLLVLDNLEGLVCEGDVKGHFRPGFEAYGTLLNRVAETSHQSCLLLTSRERAAELRHLEGRYSQVRSLRLTGLDSAACQQLFVEKGVIGTSAEQERLTDIYAGNPLALKIVAETIVDLFGGKISAFLAGSRVIFGSITDLLSEQLARLSPLEQRMLCSLAIARELMTLDELLAVLVKPLPRPQVLEAIDSLRRRSLIEPGKRPIGFTLQSVVLEYVTAFLIAEGTREIQQHCLKRLIQHGLSYAHAKEYVRQTQERLLVSPLLDELQRLYPDQTDGATGGSPVEVQLLRLLDELRRLSAPAQGYGPANLITLLRLRRGHLRGLDLSKLCIRGAYLQGTEMQETSVAFSLIRDTVWTEAVSAIRSVAVSQDGRLWAAGGTQGEVRVWGEGGRSLHLYFQAHTGLVVALTFSPNGRMLASGSLDGTVKLWNMEAETVGMAGAHNPSSSRGTLLWMGWSDCPQFLAFSPDGGMLASSGQSVTVRVFDTTTGTSLQNLRHPARAFGIAWSPDGKQFASTCFDGQLRLWERLSTWPSTCTEILRFLTSWETGPVYSLAFSPDGRTLVTTNWDRRIKLWEVGNGRLLHTFEGEMDRRNDLVAWSSDGRQLASSGYKKAIRVFDVEERRIRSTLHGHTSNINDLAFTPDGHSLLSAGTDGTLWVWDVETARCMRVMEGYALSLYSIDWSPDGTHLVSGGTGGYVSIWERSGEMPPRDLLGHRWVVRGVGWSPDGRFVASSGWEGDIYLWDPASPTCVQNIRDPQIGFECMAWSSDGSFLAVGTFLEGLWVWDMRESRRRFVLEPGQAAFHSVAWSPDGGLLAGGSDDGSVYLWESANGTRQHKLLGHHGNVISLAWSPNGRYLASGSGNSGNGELFLWDMRNVEVARAVGTRTLACHYPYGPRLLRTFDGHPDLVCAVAWSPHGDQLISGCADGTLRWWDVQTGECVKMPKEHQSAIRALKVSPDGQFLASCGDDGAIRIWDVESSKHLQTLRRDRPYERLNITGIKGLTEAEIESLRALGAIDEAALEGGKQKLP